MPLPLALVAVPAVLGLFGVKKSYDAYSARSDAKNLTKEAQYLFETARRRLKRARARCTKALTALGELKLDVWDRQLGRFVGLFGKLKNVDLSGAARVEELEVAPFSKEAMAEIEDRSGFATEIVARGATAIGSGALAGIASYGGATMFASASTGASISLLKGVAATNATLAWFGGGSLAAGGAGMAGGMAVLGGIVAAPVLAVGGVVLAAGARKGLATAHVSHAEATTRATEFDSATARVNSIHAAVRQFQKLLVGLDKRFGRVLDELAGVMAESGLDYSKYSERDRRVVHVALLFAQGIKLILETPILTEEGVLATASSETAVRRGKELLGLDTEM